MRGDKEGFSGFERLSPIFFKAYACKAYEALCLAGAHLIAANTALFECNDDSLNPDVVGHLQIASSMLERGYPLLKNIDGADDVGVVIPEAYYAAKKIVDFHALFYRARLIVISPDTRAAAMDHLRMLATFPRTRTVAQAESVQCLPISI